MNNDVTKSNAELKERKKVIVNHVSGFEIAYKILDHPNLKKKYTKTTTTTKNNSDFNRFNIETEKFKLIDLIFVFES